MAYLNKVMIIGNIGKDPEYKNLQNGKVANFSIATTRRWKDNNGETKEQTDWHSIVVFGKMVDTMQNLHICKGTSLYVEGEIHNRSWTENTTGLKRYTTEIQVMNFQLLTPRQNGEQGQQGGQQNTGAPQNTNLGTPQDQYEDEELPW